MIIFKITTIKKLVSNTSTFPCECDSLVEALHVACDSFDDDDVQYVTFLYPEQHGNNYRVVKRKVKDKDKHFYQIGKKLPYNRWEFGEIQNIPSINAHTLTIYEVSDAGYIL